MAIVSSGTTVRATSSTFVLSFIFVSSGRCKKFTVLSPGSLFIAFLLVLMDLVFILTHLIALAAVLESTGNLLGTFSNAYNLDCLLLLVLFSTWFCHSVAFGLFVFLH